MKIINIKLSETFSSSTNPRGKIVEDQVFKDLVSSIKEKGILVPVIAREVKGRYEIVAGNRRRAAAIAAGKTEIPAEVRELTDQEAQEIQIIENLQRADVHPLDEGEAYRKLIEQGAAGYGADVIAAKVGKSESHVKQRLYLTNLTAPAAVAYRSGKINDGHAVLIAKLSSGDQAKALKYATDRYDVPTTKELKEWIQREIYSPMGFQPWLRSSALQAAVGKCVECDPKRMSLFGAVKEGACTDLRCWTRKMTSYINQLSTAEKLTKVSDEYSSPAKGLLSRSDYTKVGKGDKRCESVHGAIIAQGSGIGKKLMICSNRKCKTHHPYSSHYERTPAEKAKIEREKKADERKEEAKKKALVAAVARVKWPLSKEQLGALVDLIIEEVGYEATEVAKDRGLIETPKGGGYAASQVAEKALRKAIVNMTDVQKMQLIFELLLKHHAYLDDINKMLKRI